MPANFIHASALGMAAIMAGPADGATIHHNATRPHEERATAKA
jgi:hypothetical protein